MNAARREGGKAHRTGPETQSPATLLTGAAGAAIALALGTLAAQPIYQTPWLWLVAAAALAIGVLVAWLRARARLGAVPVIALLLGLFALTVVPVAVPQALGGGFFTGLTDGLAAVALGWKQLLTLTLPVGTYRTVLVPFYIVSIIAAFLTVRLSQLRGRAAAVAALPMLLPVAFGTVFGASNVSKPFSLGPVNIVAPRELGLWLGAALLAAVWIVWTAGRERRAALKLGRSATAPQTNRGGVVRAAIGALILVVCLGAGALLAPVANSGVRQVPRDSVDPELVVRERPSPLAGYRGSKTDTELDRVMFSVRGSNGLPDRLSLAVLDSYDGTDFHVSDGAAGLFTRFPSGERLKSPSSVEVHIGEGYQDIWVPTATLGSAPNFAGQRAQRLDDGFYVNRETGGAIAFAKGEKNVVGLRQGDSYTAPMETKPQATELGSPVSKSALVDLETAPELGAWIEAQELPGDDAGLAALIERLRERGYLSHSLTDEPGTSLWLARLADEHGTAFESSAGGHSLARVEGLFAQLNEQQRAAGEKATSEQLVAGVGDDEQFAAAAALIARALGYDSRVVVGVRTAGDGVPGVPVCERDCTGDTLAAWIEVRGSAGNWVPFDVTPQVEIRPQRLEEGEQLPQYPSTPEERDVREIDPPIGLGEQGESATTDNEDDQLGELWPVLRAALLGAGALTFITLPLLYLPAAKRLRARRRAGAAEPEVRAVGAWNEMVDRALDQGVDVPTGTTRARVAQALSTEAAGWLAQETDRAVFGNAPTSPQQADLMWAAARDDHAARKADQSRWARLRAAYSLRSYGFGRRGGRSRQRAIESEKR